MFGNLNHLVVFLVEILRITMVGVRGSLWKLGLK